MTATEFAALDPLEREEIADAFIAEVIGIWRQAIEDPAYGGSRSPALRNLVEQIHRRELDIPTLARVLAYTLFEMQWRARWRPLTDDEIRIEAAAWRLSDAIHGPRTVIH